MKNRMTVYDKYEQIIHTEESYTPFYPNIKNWLMNRKAQYIQLDSQNCNGVYFTVAIIDLDIFPKN